MCQINPKRIKLYICKYSHIYVFNEEHGSYLLEDETKVSQRFNFYLNENLTDISSLDKNIKIIIKFIINFYDILRFVNNKFYVILIHTEKTRNFYFFKILKLCVYLVYNINVIKWC